MKDYQPHHINDAELCQIASNVEAACVNAGLPGCYNPRHLPMIPVRVDIMPRNVTIYEIDPTIPWLLYPVRDIRIGVVTNKVINWPNDPHGH